MAINQWRTGLLLLAGLSISSGCSDDNPPPADPAPVAGPTAWTPGPVAEPFEPNRLTLAWRIAYTTERNARMDRRMFRGPDSFPSQGLDQGVNLEWLTQPEEEDGSFARQYNGWIYGVSQVDPPEGHNLYALGDRVFNFGSGGIAQPGDVYGRGNRLVPLAGAAETGLVGIRSYGRRGRPKVQIFSTPHEIHLNLSDRTWAHWLHGDATARWLGVPLLNLGKKPLEDIRLKVLESEHFEATSTPFEGVVGGAVTQVPFSLQPKAAWTDTEEEITATLRVESPSLEFSYEVTVTLPKAAPSEPYRMTFRSPIDGSVQYYGVRRPEPFDPTQSYGMVLSLHGASVEGFGQVKAYSDKDWAYIIAPTNRRPFGFDWEEWGRLNALSSLNDAVARFEPDPTQMHLTGHSMGGHGTWHNGVMSPGRFATLGPSAGWQSFYTYGGSQRPSGAFARSRAHSDTANYMTNLARRGIYIIHGTADDNVPLSEGRTMRELALAVTEDVQMHEQEGAGHWWNGDQAEGADCVDWPPLFEFMQAHRLDPFETDFSYRSPRPGYASSHSYVHLESALSADADLELESQRTDDRVELTTTNTRSMRINTKALRQAGVSQLVVDGDTVSLDGDEVWLGPQTGKTAAHHGPFNQVFHQPFCFVYDDRVPGYASHAAYLSSHWALQGNGSACGLSIENQEALGERNPVFIGGQMEDLPLPEGFPVRWNDDEIVINGEVQSKAGLQFVAPFGERLGAVLVTTPGHEDLLEGTAPFSSRSGMPDYLAWTTGQALLTGHFDAEWRFAQ